MIFVWNPGIWKVWVNYETAMYSVCGETNYIMTYINDIYDVTWLFTWRHFIICFNTICQNVLLCPPWLHCCHRHSSGKTSRQVKYRGLPKGGVIKGCDGGGVIKDTCMYSYQGCKNPVFYSKYIINSDIWPWQSLYPHHRQKRILSLLHLQMWFTASCWYIQGSCRSVALRS